MPTSNQPKLPQRKLREFIGKSITVKKVISGKSTFGDYVLLITDTESIISSGKVVLKNAAEIAGNLPATVKVTERGGKNGFKYLLLE